MPGGQQPFPGPELKTAVRAICLGDEGAMVCVRPEPDNTKTAPNDPSLGARVKAAHAIIATSEPRLYANIALGKSVIAIDRRMR
jgi:L-fucose mutarotase/ribose pyranase (RbsD/FucU family)